MSFLKNISRRFRSSISNRDPKRSILLIGAYGNDNLGDVIQAEILGAKLKTLAPDFEVFAASKSQLCPFFDPEHSYGWEWLKSPKNVNSFSLVLIGGGGLLASRHRPLEDPLWASVVDVPVAFLAVGAKGSVAESCRSLIEKAFHVSVRDEFSLGQMGEVGFSEVSLVRDPVLASSELFHVERSRNIKRLIGIDRPKRMMWIFRPNFPSISERKIIDNLIEEEDIVVQFFPSADSKGDAYSSLTVPVFEVRSLGEFERLAAQVDAIITARLHGAVLGFHYGIATFGLSSGVAPYPKVEELFSFLGIPQMHCTLPNVEPFVRNIRKEYSEIFEEFHTALYSRKKLEHISRDFDRELFNIVKSIR